MPTTSNPLILRPQLERKIRRTHNDPDIERSPPIPRTHVKPPPILHLAIYIVGVDVQAADVLNPFTRQAPGELMWWIRRHHDVHFPRQILLPGFHFQLEVF